MAATTVTPPTQQPFGSLKSFNTVWNNLTAPASSLSLVDQQRARLLASVAFVFLPVAIFAIFSTPVSNYLQTGVFTPPSGVLLFSLGLDFLAYILSRTPRYALGALLMIATTFLSVTVQIIVTPAPITTPVTYFFMSLSIILSSLLMTSRETFIAGVLSVITIVVLSSNKSLTGAVEFAPVSFALVVTVTSSIVSFIRDRNLQELELSQKDLRQQVIETLEARVRAERSDKVKSAFLASMSHELRTPLNAIINFTRYVAKGSMGPINTEQKDTLDEVVDSAKHLLNLINDVLDMSKIETGSLVLFVEDNLNVNSIVDTVVSTGKSLILDKPLAITVDVAPDVPVLRGDRQRITQILLNIMSNACKFTDEGSIDFKVKKQGNEVVFSIQDTGSGIKPEDREDVFQPFKQTSSGLRQGGGTGLGMPISKNLTEAHGGRLWLESQFSKGTTFYVALPIKSETLKPA